MRREQELGKAGEDFAAAMLEQKGYRILERNYRFKRAEVDIIAQHGRHMIFVEVKARSGLHYGYPEASINKKKVNLLARAASHYTYVQQFEGFIRFDVVALEWKNGNWECLHIEDAFFPYD